MIDQQASIDDARREQFGLEMLQKWEALVARLTMALEPKYLTVNDREDALIDEAQDEAAAELLVETDRALSAISVLGDRIDLLLNEIGSIRSQMHA